MNHKNVSDISGIRRFGEVGWTRNLSTHKLKLVDLLGYFHQDKQQKNHWTSPFWRGNIMSSRDLGGVQGVRFLVVFEFSRQNGGDKKRTDFPQKVAFWFQEMGAQNFPGKSREVGEIWFQFGQVIRVYEKSCFRKMMGNSTTEKPLKLVAFQLLNKGPP